MQNCNPCKARHESHATFEAPNQNACIGRKQRASLSGVENADTGVAAAPPEEDLVTTGVCGVAAELLKGASPLTWGDETWPPPAWGGEEPPEDKGPCMLPNSFCSAFISAAADKGQIP